MSPRTRFQKMANDVRAITPDTDDSFWNFYRNTLAADTVRLMTVPVVFKNAGIVTARAEFQCLPSPYQMMWLALDRTLADHPRLRWDSVSINNGREYTRDEAQATMAADPLVRHAHQPARSAYDLLHQFNMALRAIDIAHASPRDIRAAYDDANMRMAAQICAGAYEVKWKQGGTGWLSHVLPGLRRG